MKVRSSIVGQEESNFIRYQLTLKGRPREVKAGLQRLCAHYDRGFRLADPHELRMLVRALLWDDAAIVRRWSYKALAMFGERRDSFQLAQRLRIEADLENQSWGIAAIIALAKDAELRKVCAETGLDHSVPLMLAARLFANARWLQLNGEPPTINIERAEPLTLKWASLLAGYSRAPTNMFHPAYENRILLAKLNVHPVPDVSEYSVWALWQNPDYNVQDLGMSFHAVPGRPDNVRRWVNRLLTKEAAFIGNNLDLFDELRRDDATGAREGLALGIRDSYVPGLNRRVLDWHEDEPEELVRDLLLEHMAHAAEHCLDYADLVERNYTRSARESGLRQRLLAASRGKPLYATLRRIEIAEQIQQAKEPPAQAQLAITIGDMTVNNTNFNAGRDIVGQNLVGGDMIASANRAVQHMEQERQDQQTVLRDLLQFLQNDKSINEHQRNEAIKAIEAVAATNTATAKRGLVDTLKMICAGTTAVVGTVDQVQHFIETISKWF